jgi:hypothetical protein
MALRIEPSVGFYKAQRSLHTSTPTPPPLCSTHLLPDPAGPSPTIMGLWWHSRYSAGQTAYAAVRRSNPATLTVSWTGPGQYRLCIKNKSRIVRRPYWSKKNNNNYRTLPAHFFLLSKAKFGAGRGFAVQGHLQMWFGESCEEDHQQRRLCRRRSTTPREWNTFIRICKMLWNNFCVSPTIVELYSDFPDWFGHHLVNVFLRKNPPCYN